MFLKALQTVFEKFPRKDDPRQLQKTGKRIGSGHIFWHPNDDRAKRLLTIEPPNVAKATSEEAADYVAEGLKGKVDTKTGSVIRQPMAEADFDPMCLDAYKERESKKLDAAKKVKGKPAAAEAAEPGKSGGAEGEVDDDGPEPEEKAKGGKGSK